MKKILYVLLAVFIAGCQKEGSEIPTPSDVSNVQVEPRIGAALLKWNVPADSNFLYLEVRYTKNGQVVKTNVSKHTDSVLVTGLLNKLDYVFEVQAYNRSADKVVAGKILTTASVKPIRRPMETLYFANQLTKVEGITASMLETFTQETTEGPKANLIDGNKATYWHSAWSGATAPLPHWIRINFPQPTTLGAMKYNFRQNGDTNGRPSKFAVETSEDGVSWVRKWTSKDALPVNPVADERSLDFGENFNSRFFRIMILANPGNTTFTHLGEISFFAMKEEVTDLEALAEANY